MSTIYRIKDGIIEVCGSCGTQHNGGEQMIRLTSLDGERLGAVCWECYEDEQDDIWN